MNKSLFSLFALVFFAVGSSSFAGSCSSTAAGEDPEIQASQSFEEAYPLMSGSLREMHPRTYRKVLEVFSENPTFLSFFPAGIEKGTSGAVIMEEILQGRNSIAQKLKVLSHQQVKDLKKEERVLQTMLTGRKRTSAPDQRKVIEKNEVMIWFLDVIAAAFEIPIPTRAGDASVSLKWSRFRELLEQARSLNFSTPKQFNSQLDYYPELVKVFWGGVRAAMCVPNLLVWSVRLEALSFCPHNCPKYPLEKLTKEERNFLLDVVFREEAGRFSWGEVNVANRPQSLGSKSWDKLMKKIEQLKVLREKLDPGTPLHLFFINGVHADAKAQLERMGLLVHGAVVTGISTP